MSGLKVSLLHEHCYIIDYLKDKFEVLCPNENVGDGVTPHSHRSNNHEPIQATDMRRVLAPNNRVWAHHREVQEPVENGDEDGKICLQYIYFMYI